jgi:hypothetical protein
MQVHIVIAKDDASPAFDEMYDSEKCLFIEIKEEQFEQICTGLHLIAGGLLPCDEEGLQAEKLKQTLENMREVVSK